MKISKLLLHLTLCISSCCAIAQNGWTTCSTTAGTLSGNITAITLNDTTAAAVFTVTPSPTSSIPQTEFLIIQQDSLAADSLGWAIISTSLDGVVSAANLGLVPGDTFSIVSFSYDIQQIKLAVQGILTNSVPFIGSCCALLDSQAPISGICDSLNAAGIQDSSDVNNIDDLLTFLGAFGSGGSSSLSGLNTVLVEINDQLGTLGITGCTNGVNEICYATDSLEINQDLYAVVSIQTNNLTIKGSSSLKISVSPNPFNEQINTIIQPETTAKHSIRVFDTRGKIVYTTSKYLQNKEQSIALNLGNLASGVYFLQVADEHQIATQKIIKR